VVAERLGYPPETALTLGRFVAGSSARAKAGRLGISDEKQDAEERRARSAEMKPSRQTVHLLGRDIPVVAADDGTLRREDDGKPYRPRIYAKTTCRLSSADPAIRTAERIRPYSSTLFTPQPSAFNPKSFLPPDFDSGTAGHPGHFTEDFVSGTYTTMPLPCAESPK
jgi:hypothetical protein